MKGVFGFIGVVLCVYIVWISWEFIQMRKQKNRLEQGVKDHFKKMDELLKDKQEQKDEKFK